MQEIKQSKVVPPEDPAANTLSGQKSPKFSMIAAMMKDGSKAFKDIRNERKIKKIN